MDTTSTDLKCFPESRSCKMKTGLITKALLAVSLLATFSHALGAQKSGGRVREVKLGEEFPIEKGLTLELAADQGRHLTITVLNLHRRTRDSKVAAPLEIRENGKVDVLEFVPGQLEHNKLVGGASRCKAGEAAAVC
jgi:hypothetical protein